jgi:LuxR family transcriptional regulator, maltose regulon positive regulatory protein
LQASLDILHGETGRAIELSKQILEVAARSNWLRFQIEGHFLLGVANHKAGSLDEAYRETQLALELAEPEGFVRLFIDAGKYVQALLEEMRQEVEKQQGRSGPLLAYIDRLLAALGVLPAPSHSLGSDGEVTVDLPTPLSERERQILRLLAGGLSNDDIAANLFLSTNTVKTHLKRIFEKMGVNSRLEAVNKARGAKII